MIEFLSAWHTQRTRTQATGTVRNVVIANVCFPNFRSVVMSRLSALKVQYGATLCQIAMGDHDGPVQSPRHHNVGLEAKRMTGIVLYHAFEVHLLYSQGEFFRPLPFPWVQMFTVGDGNDECFRSNFNNTGFATRRSHI